MIISMLQNYNHKYSSHYNIIKFVGFESIYYAINLGDISSSIIFSDSIFIFLSIYYHFESIKYFFSIKKFNKRS